MISEVRFPGDPDQDSGIDVTSLELPPADLVKAARAGNLNVIAVTDHDTVAGVYHQLCLQPLGEGHLYAALGPSSAEREKALANRWAGPLCWDDNIDDSKARRNFGRDGTRFRAKVPTDWLDTEVARLTAAGKKASAIAEELSTLLQRNLSERTVVRARSRHRATQASDEAA